MNERNQVEEYEIDLLRVIKVMWQNAIRIVICGIVCGALTLSYTAFFITPLYQANCLIYVNNSSFSVGSSNFSITSADISASQSLVDTYIVILKSRSTLNEVIAKSGIDKTYTELSGMVSAAAVNDTEIFSVTVESPDPEEAKLIANTIADVLPSKVSDIIDGSSVRIVDHAVKPAVKSSPSLTKNTAIGLIIGLALMSLFIVLRDLFDDIIRSEDYLTQNFNIPILASIPNLGGSDKDKYGKYGYKKYGYGYRKYGYAYRKYGYRKMGYGYGYEDQSKAVESIQNSNEGGEK